MSGIQILNAVLAAAGAAMGLVLSVVCIIYMFYVPSVPRLAPDLQWVSLLALGFWLVAGTSAGVFLAHRRGQGWRWYVQPLPLLPLAGLVAWLWRT